MAYGLYYDGCGDIKYLHWFKQQKLYDFTSYMCSTMLDLPFQVLTNTSQSHTPALIGGAELIIYMINLGQ